LDGGRYVHARSRWASFEAATTVCCKLFLRNCFYCCIFAKTKLAFLQFIDPRSFAVLGDNATFREDSFNTYFNPTSTPPPFFQVFDEAFLSILGPNPSIRQVASNSTFAFAHEAPIYVAATDEVFFVSNDGGPLGLSDLNNNNLVGKISLKDVDAAFAANETVVNVPVTFVSV
jgi:gluconolactonase